MSSWLLLVSLLPLDVVVPGERPGAEGKGLRIEARVEGRRLRARLINVGSAPLRVFVGLTCGGPSPFQLLVDGQERPLREWACTEPVPLARTLAPGQAHALPPEPLPAGREVAVIYRPNGDLAFWCDDDCWSGELRSPPVRGKR